jgi:hypothetical protein
MTTTSSDVCSHDRPQKCDRCDRCLKCHMDTCLGPHATVRGNVGKIIREWRKQTLEHSEDGTVPTLRRSVRSVTTCLNEDVLSAPLTSAVAAAEAVNRDSFELEPIVALETCLGLGLSDRVLQRSGRFSSSSLLAPTSLRDACTILSKVTDRTIAVLTEDDAGALLLRQAFVEKITDRTMKTALSHQSLVADRFVRSLDDRIAQRAAFAQLVAVHNKDELELIIDAAVARSLQDSAFLKKAKPTYYWSKKKMVLSAAGGSPTPFGAQQTEMKSASMNTTRAKMMNTPPLKSVQVLSKPLAQLRWITPQNLPPNDRKFDFLLRISSGRFEGGRSRD